MPSTAAAVRSVVRDAPFGAFIRTSDIPGSRAGVVTALSRLHASGELVRVRNGLYWKGVKSRFGPGRPNRVDAAIAAAGPEGAGPTGWAAAQMLGLSTQIPAEPEVAVAGPVPSLAGVKFHRRNNLARRDLNTLEIALLEVLRAYPAYSEVGPDGLKDRVCSLAADGELRLDAVAVVAGKERSPALRRNLKLILEPHGSPGD